MDMNKIIVLVTLGVFLVIGIGSAVFFSQKHSSGEVDHHQHEMTIDSERAFLEHMIPHHIEAIEVSRILLQNESTLRPLNELAQSIIDAQTVEVADMERWLGEWYGTTYQDSGEYMNMMRSLEGLSTVERDRIYLEDMIVHHEAAIAAARQVLELTIHPEVEQLANNIIMTQETEIGLIKELLALLPQ